MTTATIVFESSTVTLKTVNGHTIRAEHATARAAQVYAAKEALRAEGWCVRGPTSSDGYRRPLLLPGEKMMSRLDGSRCDERAQGFTAERGDSVLRVDACAGLPVAYLIDEGDTEDAITTVELFIR